MERTVENEAPLSEYELKICLIQSEWRKVSRVKNQDFPRNYAENGDKFVFFWYDLIDFKPRQEISLIGKKYNREKNSFESCCVTISDVEKVLYFLPRQLCDSDSTRAVKLRDVYDEFKRCHAKRLGLKGFKSKVVVKRSLYPPFLAKYLEVTCKKRDYKIEIEEGDTFSKVSGTGLGFVETFLLYRRVKGPCWLEVQNSTKKRFLLTKSPMEVSCGSIEDVTIANHISHIPEFRILTFNIRTVYNKVKNKNEICSISWIFCDEYDLETQRFSVKEHFCGLHPVFGFPENFKEHMKTFSDTRVVMSYTEKDLLCLFLDAFERYEIDMVLSYDLTGRDIDILFEKIASYNLKYSSLGCRRSKKFINENHKLDLFCGKLLFNLKSLSEYFVQSTSYSMEELVRDVLKAPFVKVDENFVRKSFVSSTSLRQLITLTMWETYCVFGVATVLKMIPFTLELTRLCGNRWNETLNGTVSALCESLLTHAFHEGNFIVPDKLRGDFSCEDSENSSFRGGLVLEPSVGLHNDYIVALDYFSLYPNIIREFNLCLSTYSKNERGKYVYIEDRGEGVLPKLIRRLLTARKSTNDVQQAVIKRVTNALYGYLAYEKSRFYSKEIAEFVARSGREILTKTVAMINEELGFDIVYGDTDSVMFKTNCDRFETALEVAQKVRDRVNAEHEHVKIEISSIYRPFVVFSKKKYAGIECRRENLGVTYSPVHKGLEMVRRDYPGVVKMLQGEILSEILSRSLSRDTYLLLSSFGFLQNDQVDKMNIRNVLKEFKRKFNNGNFPVEQFGITKKLNVNPHDYKENNYPHIQVALSDFGRRNDIKRNDYVTYVYCCNGNDTKAYHIDEVNNNLTPKVLDVKYYMEAFVLPVAFRTVRDFGFTENELRGCLGLKLKDQTHSEWPRKCYEVLCVFCSATLRSTLTDLDFLRGCGKCRSKTPKNIANYLTLLIRMLLIKYSSRTKYISTNPDNNQKELCKSRGTIKEVLETIVETLRKNHLDDLVKTAKNALDKLHFESKVQSIPKLDRRHFRKQTCTAYCVFCSKEYSFQSDTLGFSKPCSDCNGKRYKSPENYFRILLRKLTEKLYDLPQKCTNLACKSTTGYLGLKQWEVSYCGVCEVGRTETETKWGELHKTLRCMLFSLRKKQLDKLAEMVEDVLEASEYYHINLDDLKCI